MHVNFILERDVGQVWDQSIIFFLFSITGEQNNCKKKKKRKRGERVKKDIFLKSHNVHRLGLLKTYIVMLRTLSTKYMQRRFHASLSLPLRGLEYKLTASAESMSFWGFLSLPFNK